MEHLSIHYIYHLIKKVSGLSFQNLLNYIRVESAEKLLNENKLTLTHISETCGFSANHITIPINLCYPGGNDIHKSFPLRILLDTPEALTRILYYKSELMALKPAVIMVSESDVFHNTDGAQLLTELTRCGLSTVICKDLPELRTTPVHTASDAFEIIKKKPDLLT